MRRYECSEEELRLLEFIRETKIQGFLKELHTNIWSPTDTLAQLIEQFFQPVKKD